MHEHAALPLRRPRLLRVLADDPSAVRVVAAPWGSGKSALLADYARARNVPYVALPPNADEASVERLLAETEAADEVVLDDVDRIAPEARPALLRALNAGLGRRRYVLGASRPGAVSDRPPCIDAAALAFDEAEIIEAAKAAGVAASSLDAEQLLYDTEGWPLLVAWLIGDAAHENRPLRNAFAAWRERSGGDVLALLANRAGDPDRWLTYRQILSGGQLEDCQSDLADLAALGFPVRRTRVELRPYRALLGLPQIVDASPVPRGGVMHVSLFGRFGCTIDGRPVAFARRREQSLLAYLALSPDGRAARADLQRLFWADAEPATASQGLRTSLSRLRKAIAEACGGDAETFLQAGTTAISLNLSNVTVDARRFAEHVDQGRALDARRDRRGAEQSYRAAERLYREELLAGEPVEAPLQPFIAEYSVRFEELLKRLVEIRIEPSGALALGTAPRRRAEDFAPPQRRRFGYIMVRRETMPA